MDFMQYRNETAFQRSPNITEKNVSVGLEGNEDMSVEDLVLSMQQDLFVEPAVNRTNIRPACSNSTGPAPQVSVHRQPGAVSLRVNSIHSVGFVEDTNKHRTEHSSDRVAEKEGSASEAEQSLWHYQQQVQNHHQHDQKPYSAKMVESTPYSGSNYHKMPSQQDLSSDSKPDIATHQNLMSNGFVRHSQAQPQLASQFYQQLRMSWGSSQPTNVDPLTLQRGEHYQYPADLSGYSSQPLSNEASHFEPEVSPRMLPKPPQEPRRGSRTRSSLRRAANLLLSRSRQSLSDGETARKPTPPSTPRGEVDHKKDTKSQSIRERLQKNKSKMGDLLRSPNLSHEQHPVQGDSSINNSFSPQNAYMYQTKTSHRKYASAENLQEIGHGRNVQTSNIKKTVDIPKHESYMYSQSYDTVSSRSDVTDGVNQTGSPLPGFKLRRHASGPIYQPSDTREKSNFNRGYHTADSDTDSGVGRVATHRSKAELRKDVNKVRPPAMDTMRMVSKKREVSTTSSRHISKSISGPVKADHSIHPVRTSNECSLAGKPDLWTEQGARPKRSHSVESLETEEVRHEVFPDTPIGMEHGPSHNSRTSKEHRHRKGSADMNLHVGHEDRACRGSRPSSPSCSRPPSPSRSVHFEDSHSPQYGQSEKRPHSQNSSERSKHHSNTTPRNDSTVSNTHPESVNMHFSDRHIVSSRDSTYSSIEDAYSSIPNHDSRVITDENPYEEIQIPDQNFNKTQKRHSSKNVPKKGFSEMDSIDGLYAKVEKKRHQRRKEPHLLKRGEEGDKKDQEPGSSRDIVIRGSDEGDPIYAKVDKSRKKPPSGLKPSSRHRSHSDISRNSNGNPCITSDFDDSISHVSGETDDGVAFQRNYKHVSELSESRLSISSRASISEKMQSFGKATRKKLTSMRRALSLDRIDTTGQEDDPQPKFKRSPSLRSLTGFFSKRDKENAESPGKFNKRRSASVSGLHVRPQRSSEETDVTSPSHMRKVGKLLQMNSDGSQMVELIKPPSGPFGFYIARGTSNFGSGVFVTRLGDGHPAKILAGLLAVGDEILEINGVDVRDQPIDDVYDMMMDNDKLTLRLVPIATRSTWTD